MITGKYDTSDSVVSTARSGRPKVDGVLNDEVPASSESGSRCAIAITRMAATRAMLSFLGTITY